MRNFIHLWVGRTRHIPPRDFWPTLLHFLHYAFIQAGHAARRSTGNTDVLSHLNFKRAHYLEKAMLYQYDRSPDLDASYKELKGYLDSDLGKEDGCYLYLNKLAEEYSGYPDGFTCYMHKVKHKTRPVEDVRTLRRIIIQRRSYRRFKSNPVPLEALKKIVEAGSYVPTSCNAQPLHFITLTDHKSLDLVFGAAGGAQAWKDGIPSAVIIATDRRHYKPVEQHPVMFQDIAAATQNCLLMVEALGLSACWVSLISDSHIENQDAVYKQLGLPRHLLIGAAIAIGKSENAVCLVPRRPLDRIWHKETYSDGSHSNKALPPPIDDGQIG